MPDLSRTVPDFYATRIGSNIWTGRGRGFADCYWGPLPVTRQGRRIDLPVRSRARRTPDDVSQETRQARRPARTSSFR